MTRVHAFLEKTMLVPQRTLGTLACVFVGSGLIACTTWYHPYKSNTEFHQDRLKCRAVAKQMMGSYFVVGSQAYVSGAELGRAIEENSHVSECLRAEGWTTERTNGAAKDRPWSESVSSDGRVRAVPWPNSEPSEDVTRDVRPTSQDPNDLLRCYQMAADFEERGLDEYAAGIRKECRKAPR
jgi:hypothetical protein